MKALILAAGRGTRVQPLARTIPKPMLPILNKPVMETLIELLREHGVERIVINTSYLSSEIESYFRDRARFGVEIAYSFEGSMREGRLHDEPLGSAGVASRLARNRMYFEGHQMYRPNQRVYALHRNGYAGMQRFASFLWSGDVQSTWETLKTHVAVNAGLSGIRYWGTDIGGFVPTQDYTGELFVRWFQFAAFTPLFRSHGREWRLHLPWGWTAGQMIGFRETPSSARNQSSSGEPAGRPLCSQNR